MSENMASIDESPEGEELAAPAPTPPKRGPGHRGQDVRDTMAEMAAKAHEISLEAGSRMTGTMREVIGAAAGLTVFAIASARDLVQYMVRRGQMSQDEADKLMRDVEAAHATSPRQLLKVEPPKVETPKKVAPAAPAPAAQVEPPVVPRPPKPVAPEPTKAVKAVKAQEPAATSKPPAGGKAHTPPAVAAKVMPPAKSATPSKHAAPVKSVAPSKQPPARVKGAAPSKSAVSAKSASSAKAAPAAAASKPVQTKTAGKSGVKAPAKKAPAKHK